jgi:hypothetical protein
MRVACLGVTGLELVHGEHAVLKVLVQVGGGAARVSEDDDGAALLEGLEDGLESVGTAGDDEQNHHLTSHASNRRREWAGAGGVKRPNGV